MYKDCLKCAKLGYSCDGPNFLAMSIPDLISWCNARRKQVGLTYDRIAEETGLSKGTVSGFFSATHADYRIETIRPILKLLVGGEWDDNPCDYVSAEERERFEAAITQKDEQAQRYKKHIDELQATVADMKKAHAEEIGRMEKVQAVITKVARQRRIELIVVSIGLAVTLALIITAFVLDAINPSRGFFWLVSVLKPQSIIAVFNKWRI